MTMNYLKLTDPDNTWGLDIETNGLNPDKIWVVCLVNYKTKEERSFTDKRSFNAWLKANPDSQFITHNGLKADIPWLNSLWKSNINNGYVIDTFVLSQLFDPNLPKPDGLAGHAGTHSLEAWGVRVKSAKMEFDDWSKYSQEMEDYCFQDVKLTLKVYKQLVKELKKLKFTEQSVALEHLVTPIIGKQQRDGFYFDKQSAESLLSRLRVHQGELGRDISELFPPRLELRCRYKYRETKDGQPFQSYNKHKLRYPVVTMCDDGFYECFDYDSFNIGSPAQRTKRLLELGYTPTSFTPTGSPKVDEEALVAFAKTSGIREVQYIADWLVLEGRASMIEGWLNNLGDDSCIHGNVFTCGAQSRRMKHSSPNTANIPRVSAKYGRECRALWLSRPGRCLVGVDAVALEGRMLLHYLNSPAAYDFFINGDPHQSNSDALKAKGLDIGRDPSKNYFYGFMYGAGNAKLASMYGSSDPSVGETIRRTLETNVPGLGNLIHTIQSEWKDNNGLLQCIDGGYVRCPSKSACLNYKLQPAGAILMKQALIIADRRLQGYDYMFVGNIHDEWQIDCKLDQAHKIGEICSDSIREAGEVLNFNVPQAGDFKVGFNWADTH
jgi:DNA polymerase I-like protein with 3'-5' exonuclease and polymerase domains